MTLAELHANEREDLSLLTIAEAASYLSISRGAVYNLLNSGALASIHIGRARRIATRRSARTYGESCGVAL